MPLFALSVKLQDLLGALVANIYNLLIIGIFIMRILNRTKTGTTIGIISFFCIIPLIYLLFAAPAAGRPKIYFIWLGLMILFLIFELLIDYIFKVQFRGTLWAVILYVMFFFAATGGMIGVAAQAGRLWAAITGCSFLIMFILAFVSRAKTGI